MSKSLTSLTLALALTFAASANADVDVYKEAIWDIHAAAPAVTGKTGEIAKLAQQTPQRKNTPKKSIHKQKTTNQNNSINTDICANPLHIH